MNINYQTILTRSAIMAAVVAIAWLMLFSCGDRFDEEIVPAKDSIFHKFYGGFDVQTGVDIKLDTDGGYLLFGSSTSFSGATDAAQDPSSRLYLVKTDIEGNEMYSQIYHNDSLDVNQLPLVNFDIDAVGFEFTTSGLVLLGNVDRDPQN
ncbi:MAG: hypothetical protein O6939_07885, partial [Bacteroidetes bacterium]|nr:hypothetical protein [Bacteroidota bacterium]